MRSKTPKNDRTLSLNVTQKWRLNETLSYEKVTLKRDLLKIDYATHSCWSEVAQTTSDNSPLIYDHNFNVFQRINETFEIDRNA